VRIVSVASLIVAISVAVAPLVGPLVAQPVQLPEGWRVTDSPTRGRASITIAGSADAVLIAVVPGTDAMTRVSVLAGTPTTGMTNMNVWPVRTSADGALQSGATMRTGAGATVTKFVAAAALANRTTAITVYLTSEPQSSAAVSARLSAVTAIMQQLRSGRAIPERSDSTARASLPVVTAGPPRDTAPVRVSAGATGLPSNVEYIGFHGYGTGMRPAILFKNGIICDCMGYAFGSGNPASFQPQHAGDFGRWRRRVDGKFEYLFDQSSDTVWSALSSVSARPLPENWRTAGTYSARSGTGFDGNMTYATSSYTFRADGTFTTLSTIAATAQSGGATVFAGAEGGKSSGRYEISGWIMQLTFADGTTERRSITWLTDPDLVWINGTVFVR
jgi:hypothetical protein